MPSRSKPRRTVPVRSSRGKGGPPGPTLRPDHRRHRQPRQGIAVTCPSTGRPQKLRDEHPGDGHGRNGGQEVTGAYHELWHVWQAFRVGKIDLRAGLISTEPATRSRPTPRSCSPRLTSAGLSRTEPGSDPCAQRPSSSTAPRDSPPTSPPNSKPSSMPSKAQTHEPSE